jgi:Homing endonuclease associated repeat
VLEACGLERGGSGYVVELEQLFEDWAAVVRKLGRAPTMIDYSLHGRYSTRPLVRHFGGWPHVPAGMLEYGRAQKLESDWKDVLDVVAKHLMERPDLPRASRRKLMRTPGRTLRPNITLRSIIEADEPFYGEPMAETPMVFCPTNEAGVAVLFGAMAKDLGFRITRVQNGFPDCEAMIEVEPGRWQRKLIEFENESRNFLSHGHKAAGCNMIVCWSHNWPECPLEVVELRSAVNNVTTDKR